MRRFAMALLALGALSVRAAAQDELGLAKQARNPLPDIIILPIQNNTNLDYGPAQGVQDGLNVQPLVSFRLIPGLNLVTRTVVPFIFNPDLGRVHAQVGVGDIQFTTYLSPSALRHWTWGIGPVLQLPTHTHPTLGNDNLGLGPAIAAFYAAKDDPWVLGFLGNSAWSLGTNPNAHSYAAGSAQPMVSYHLGHGLYLTSSPIIKIDWQARPDHQVLLPLGGGIGKVLHFGTLPVNAEISAYYNVLKRDFDADWQLRVQLQFVFPRGKPPAD